MISEARREVCHYAKKMWELGLVVWSAGNVSRRIDDRRIAVTPSAVPYESMVDEQVVIVDIAAGAAEEGTPSYELPMHLGVYRARPDVQAIVHTHAPYITTLSVLRRPLPPIIDELVLYLGGTIEVTDYAFTGTEAVGTNVVRTLGDRAGVILANHGNVCIGRTLDHAMHVAVVMENCAQVYVQALTLGTPIELPADSIAAGRKMFEAKYGL